MTDVERDQHEAFAKSANGRVWELLGQTPRTADEDRELVDAAHASLWHWRYAGALLHEQRGEWLVSHVYAVLGRANAALAHGQRCWDLTEEGNLEGFDYAYACEAMGRALAIGGDGASAAQWRERATAVAANVPDDEDRAILEGDIAAGPWAPPR